MQNELELELELEALRRQVEERRLCEELVRIQKQSVRVLS